MDSPTVEISRGLEALRLAGHKEGVVDDSALLATNKSVVEHLGPSRDNAIQSVPNVKTDTDGQQSIRDDRFQNSRLLSSKPQHVDQIGFHVFCQECQREGQYCHHHHHHHRLSQGLPRLSSKNQNSNPASCEEESAASIIDSFGTLSVSNSHHPGGGSVAASHSVVAIPRSCREEATSSLTCLDDTTVDDLAGYLDEIMFLPKPMSEMAELMYT